MIRIDEVFWLDAVCEKLERKHGVTTQEVDWSCNTSRTCVSGKEAMCGVKICMWPMEERKLAGTWSYSLSVSLATWPCPSRRGA